jgi:hypothetical protein
MFKSSSVGREFCMQTYNVNFWFSMLFPLKNKTEMPSRTESINMSMINGPIVPTLTAFALPFCSSLLGVPQSLRQP